ncbi:MAG: ChbG/HpnK family deacetylase [Acidobacteriaceae bacterium]
MAYPLEREQQQRRLIVNADDFGLTSGVNRAILELNAAGVLTSATLMASGAAFRSAAHAAFVQPSLGVGCHIVLVDGAPVLHASEIPSLATAEGFRSSLSTFALDLVRGRIRSSDIEREAIAQIRRLQSAGITVSHVDTHKHTHMFPRVLRPLLRAAVACGVSAMRNPFEPAWALRATRAPIGRRIQVHLLKLYRGQFLRAVRRAGLLTTEGAVGVLATGTLDAAALERLLAAMPAGTWELVCHPGYDDAALAAMRTRLTASRETERAALLQVLPSASGIRLIHFEQLAFPGLEQITQDSDPR